MTHTTLMIEQNVAELPPAPVSGMVPTVETGAAPGAVAVSIISNSCLLREGLAALLERHLRFVLIGSHSGHPANAKADMAHHAGHVVLLDGGLGRETAVAWTRHWCAYSPPAHVVVVDLADDVEVILACIEAGAGAYTLRGAGAQDVAMAIDRVRQGQAVCSPEMTAQLFARLAARTPIPPSPSTFSPLTARELEVLRYVAADYSNPQIAEALVIELRTVKHHVHNILDKLQLRHRWDAARFAAEQGWLGAEKRPST